MSAGTLPRRPIRRGRHESIEPVKVGRYEDIRQARPSHDANPPLPSLWDFVTRWLFGP